jgi:ketopantoate hydroxymethyltransferase
MKIGRTDSRRRLCANAVSVVMAGAVGHVLESVHDEAAADGVRGNVHACVELQGENNMRGE